MTKQEIYDALKEDGAKLNRPAQFYKKELLEEEYAMRFGFSPGEHPAPSASDQDEEIPNTHLLQEDDNGTPEKHVENIRPLKFAESGWCNELGRSYFEGVYLPKSLAEFQILKPYATEVL